MCVCVTDLYCALTYGLRWLRSEEYAGGRSGRVWDYVILDEGASTVLLLYELCIVAVMIFRCYNVMIALPSIVLGTESALTTLLSIDRALHQERPHEVVQGCARHPLPPPPDPHRYAPLRARLSQVA